MEEVFVPIALFAIIPLSIWAVSAYRFRSHAQSASVLTSMSESGQAITPELVRSLGMRGRPKHADLRTGLVLIAIALATLFLGGAIPEDEAQAIFAGFAMFPLLIGLVSVGLWGFITRKDVA